MNVRASRVKQLREERKCSLPQAKLLAEREAAISLVNRKYLMEEEVTDTEMWELLTWLVEGRR